MADTIDSNVTGARIAEETSPGVLPATPVWYPMEPNSYSDFGGSLTTKPREPINPSRQRKRGPVVDMDAVGGFNQDFTETGLLRHLQGFLFADAHIPADTQPIDGTASVAFTSTTQSANRLSAASGLSIFSPGDIVLISGFGQAATNGVKTVATASGTSITTNEAIGANEASPPASARVQKIGVAAAANDLSVVVSGTQVTLTASGAGIDFTDLNLVPGAWIFIGSDSNAFANAGNQCFARVDTISATELGLGKTTKQMVAEAAGPAVDIILPTFIRNEPDPLNIKKRTYQIERTLGRDANGVQSEYLLNSVPNELTINAGTADLLTVDLAYVCTDNEQRDGTTGVKGGTRPSLVTEDAYNTSSDVKRLRIAVVDSANPFPVALFGYAQEGTISINNNVTPNKGIGVLGAFSMTTGTFEVGGDWKVYFTTIAAVQAVRNNAEVTLDMILNKNNAGWVIDVPLLSLGDGKAEIEANQPVLLPLETSAAESALGHTLLIAHFPFLPNIA